MIVQNQCDIHKVRLSLTELGLSTGYLYLRKIQPPNLIQYSGFTDLVTVGDSGQSRQGFANAILTWTNPSAKTVYYIRKYVDDSLSGSRLLYATIPLNDGSTFYRQFIDISGVPLVISAQETGQFGSRGIAFNAIELKLNNVTILNNPASF